MTPDREEAACEGWTAEVSEKQRFAFGENWSRFLSVVDESRIQRAAESLTHMLEVERLDGKSFLDAGSGSGLFSLAARRLGASVVSFDYDPQSVACTRELRRRFERDQTQWDVRQGSVLDPEFLASLGTFDFVYSWGVLHHTGAMGRALENIAASVKAGGTLFISIYNDQGGASRRWAKVKRLYVRLPGALRYAVLIPALIKLWWRQCLIDLAAGKPFRAWRHYGDAPRGMDPWRDLVDWVGGYPFEVATPEQIFDFYRERGFELIRLKTCGGGIGCNEFVFVRNS